MTDVQDYGITTLGASAWWGLGEASGDALDLVGANDGTVANAAARNATALDLNGDGSMEWDADTTSIVVPDDAAFADPFDGGGSFFCIFDADTSGEGGFGRLWQKGGTLVYLNGSTNLKILLWQAHATTQGNWATDEDIPFNGTTYIMIAYDNDNNANNPTFYVYDGTNGHRTLTVGSGLNEDATPNGTRTTDVGSDLYIGTNSAGDRCFDGHIDEVGFLLGVTPSEAQAQALIDAGRLGTGISIPVVQHHRLRNFS